MEKCIDRTFFLHYLCLNLKYYENKKKCKMAKFLDDVWYVSSYGLRYITKYICIRPW